MCCDDESIETEEHIFWECKCYAQTRAKTINALRAFAAHADQLTGDRYDDVAGWPIPLRTHGILPDDGDLREAALDIAVSDAPVRSCRMPLLGSHLWDSLDGPLLAMLSVFCKGRLVVFTDGACSDQSDPSLRRAGYGVFYGDGHPWSASIPLAGYSQTSDRAELRAALYALENAREPTEIRSDNEYTVKGIAAYIAYRHSMGPLPKYTANLDLWARVDLCVRSAGAEEFAVTWVKGACG